jgi:molecular chaperone GrpE (heat shock protein)
MEGDWIKVAVAMLDHVFAITRAAERSGQANVIAQTQQLQIACRDVARRIGLAPYIPAIAEPFDGRAHQIPDSEYTPPAGAKVGAVLATGFTYQGQLLRRAVVMLEGEDPRETATGASTKAPEPEPDEKPSAQDELPLA